MERRVDSNMTKGFLAIGFRQPLAEAYKIMTEKKIRHLPVVDASEKVVGILSDRDILRATEVEIQDYVSFKVVEEQLTDEQLVCDYMSWPVKTVTHETDLKTVAQRMIEEKISCFIVEKNNEAVGIVTSEDLLKVLVRLLESPGEELRASLNQLAYSTPLGPIASMLSNAGI